MDDPNKKITNFLDRLHRRDKDSYIPNPSLTDLFLNLENSSSYLGYTVANENNYENNSFVPKMDDNFKENRFKPQCNVGDNGEALDRVYNPDNTKRVGHTPWAEIMKKALKNREGISYGESAPDKVNKEVNEMIRNNKKVTRVSGTMESIFKESVASNAESIWLKRECNTCGSEFMYLQLNGARVVHNCNVCVTEEVVAMFTKFDNENID